MLTATIIRSTAAATADSTIINYFVNTLAATSQSQ